ncbi:MAG: hypothetical protein V7L20_13245 [Nostoc sp.]|uniref:hypothetical protein n=1 Tax=Nostoc sp. TaxID=1180 RepID=UPI002FF7399B
MVAFLIQRDALALSADALALSVDALALSVDALALSADALALSVDALALSVDALVLSVDALALQGIAKFNSLRINEMLYLELFCPMPTCLERFVLSISTYFDYAQYKSLDGTVVEVSRRDV